MPTNHCRVSLPMLLLACLLLSGCRTGFNTPSTTVQPAPVDTGRVTVADDFSLKGTLLFAKNHNLWRLNGSTLKQITKSNDAGQPAVSPDDQQLAFIRRAKNYSDLFVMPLAGGDAVNLTHSASPIVDNNLWVASPVWSPKGDSLLYLSDRAKFQSGVIDLAIWRLTIASGRSKQITDPNPYTGGDSDPSYRPNNPKQIAFTRYSYSQDNTSLYSQIMLQNLETGNLNAITPAGEQALQPAWSPNGRHLAYIKRDGQQEKLYILSSVNPYIAPLPGSASLIASGTLAQPFWSPDGTQVGFLQLLNGSFDIWVVTLKSTRDGLQVQMNKDGAIQVTKESFVDADSRPVWIPRQV